MGVIDNIPKKKKEKAVELLNYTVDYIIESEEQNLTNIETVVLPIIIRLIIETNINISDVKKILKEITEEYLDICSSMTPLESDIIYIDEFTKKKIKELKNK